MENKFKKDDLVTYVGKDLGALFGLLMEIWHVDTPPPYTKVQEYVVKLKEDAKGPYKKDMMFYVQESDLVGVKDLDLNAIYKGFYEAMVDDKGNLKPDSKVEHPSHYQGQIEVWDYIVDKLTPEELKGAVKFNVLKYVSREREKGGDEDMLKALEYLKMWEGTLNAKK